MAAHMVTSELIATTTNYKLTTSSSAWLSIFQDVSLAWYKTTPSNVSKAVY